MTSPEHFTRMAALSAASPHRFYYCAACGDDWDSEQGAQECCDWESSIQAMQCPICLQIADDFQSAADCCLHTHPTMTAAGRERVATAVAGGVPWPDAIATYARE